MLTIGEPDDYSDWRRNRGAYDVSTWLPDSSGSILVGSRSLNYLGPPRVTCGLPLLKCVLTHMKKRTLGKRLDVLGGSPHTTAVPDLRVH
jgi:hypothetical protein